MNKMFSYLADKINPQYLIVIGGIITILGTYLAYLRSEKSSDATTAIITNNAITTGKIRDLTEKTHQLQNELNLKQDRITKLENDNFELSKTISSKALEIVDYVSSKDSYCYCFLAGKNGANESTIGIKAFGKHPLTIYSMYIVDMLNHQQTYFSNMINQTILPDYGLFLSLAVPTAGKEGFFRSFITTSNGNLVDDMKVKYLDHKLLYYHKVSKLEATGYKDIYEEKDPDYDKN